MKKKNKIPYHPIEWGFHETGPQPHLTNNHVDKVPEEFPSLHDKKIPCSENPGFSIHSNSPDDHHGEFL